MFAGQLMEREVLSDDALHRNVKPFCITHPANSVSPSCDCSASV
jgi:hypothetical protein